MRTEKEIREKIKSLEDYLEGGIVMSRFYPLEYTKHFLEGIKWTLNEDDSLNNFVSVRGDVTK